MRVRSCGVWLVAWLVLGLACDAPATTQPHAASAVEPLPYQGPILDLHTHVFFGEQSAGHERGSGGIDELLAVAGDLRIVGLGAIVVAPRPGIEQTRELNNQLVELCRAHSQLLPIGTVHPADGEAALAELERLRSLGVVMLKLHPITQQLDLASPEVAAVVGKAGELGLPVLFDFSGILNADDLGAYVMLAAQFPDAQLVLAHMGGTKFHEMLVLKVLQEYAWYRNNIWVELSGVAAMYADSPYREQLVWVLRQIGMDRVLFGSDFPYARTPVEAIADVERLGLTAAEMRMVFYDNAAALLGLEPH